VRIGAHHHLARQRVVLRHHGVRDTGHVAVSGVAQCLGLRQRAVRAQVVALRKVALGLHHALHIGHDAAAHMGWAFFHIGGVVLEHHDGLRLHQRHGVAQRGLQHVRGHAGVVLVDEAPVGPHEGALPHRGLRAGEGCDQGVPGDDFLEQGARRGGLGSRRGCRRHRPEPALAKVQQPAAAQYGGG